MIASLPFNKAIRPKVKARIFRKHANSVDKGMNYVAAAGVLPLYHAREMDDDIFAKIKASVNRVQNKPANKYQTCMDDLLKEY